MTFTATNSTDTVVDVSVRPGEDSVLQRKWGGGKCLYNAATADEAIKASPGVYYGFIVTVATAVAAIEVRDALSAGTGVVIDHIPAATPVGTRVVFPTGITCDAGIFVDYAPTATGTVVVLYI